VRIARPFKLHDSGRGALAGGELPREIIARHGSPPGRTPHVAATIERRKVATVAGRPAFPLAGKTPEGAARSPTANSAARRRRTPWAALRAAALRAPGGP